MSEIKIRHSDSNDIKEITDIYAGKSAYLNTLQLPFPSEASWERRLADLRKGSYSLVAEVSGKVVGHIVLHIEQNPRRRHVATFGMAVLESSQRKGIGKQLLSAIIDLAENWLNIQRLELEVFIDNESAIALYRKHGFIIEGESANYAFRNGELASVYRMARLK